MKSIITKALAISLLATTALTVPSIAQAQSNNAKKPDAKAQKVFDHWTKGKIEAAQPRDLVLDHRGLAYMKNKKGDLVPYGHSKKAELNQIKLKGVKTPNAKPPSNNDTTPPTIGSTDPQDGATIGTSQVFSAVVTDNVAVGGVTFNITYGGSTQAFTGVNTSGDTWSVSLEGFTTGSGSWNVTARDTAKRGGNRATSGTNSFTVDGAPPPPPPPGGDGIVTNTRWANGGAIQNRAGRLFYEMASKRGKRLTWAGYVCSGTVATDGTTGRSVIVTAAHCVYNDESKTFARNVLFIPNQDQTTGSGTDSNCSNDPQGCWAADFGVVDVDWTTRTFPNNIPWDYAYYVVNNTGRHTGTGNTDSLEGAVGTIDIDFSTPNVDDGQASEGSPDWTHALGYSYSEDPFFMYSAEDMTTEGTDNWWLPSSGLSGGSSGGPWIQPMDEATGLGPLISVNSWGYNTSPGMAGPKLSGTTASCVFDAAKSASMATGNNADGDQGVVVNNCP